MRKLLLISYHFPPDAAVGAVRPMEFAKHLPENNWETTILTVKEKYYENLDAQRYDTNGFEIVRTKKFWNINDIYALLKCVLPIKRKNSSIAVKKEWFTPQKSTLTKESLKYRIVRYYNSLLVYLPDKEIGWLFSAIIKGLRLIYNKRIDAILTTSPPHSVQLIGLVLKFLMCKTWIADFRDPWEIGLKPMRSRSLLSELIEKKMEKAVIKKCDWAVSVSRYMTERLKKLYPEYATKFITVPNGYDSEALSDFLTIKKYRAFTITYVGSLYFGRDPLIFLSAVSELIGERKIDGNGIQIRLIGDCRYSDEKSVEEMVKKMKLENVVTFIDHIPQHEALKEIAKSHVVLLLATQQPLQIPGKVYEYIGLRSKILVVCGEGATKDLLKDYPLAYMVSPNNKDEMKQVVLNLSNEPVEIIEEKLKLFPFEKYDRKTIAGEIASLLDSSLKNSFEVMNSKTEKCP